MTDPIPLLENGELEALARYHYDQAKDLEYFWTTVGAWDDYYGIHLIRLHAIGERLGEQTYWNAVARVKDDWRRRFEQLNSMPRCEACGMKYDPPMSCRCGREESGDQP